MPMDMRATVVEVLNSSAIPPRALGEPLTDDMRLANLGIDSLGIVLVLVEMSTRTGLPFERREGMEPLRTVGDIFQFGLQLAQASGPSCEAPQSSTTAVATG